MRADLLNEWSLKQGIVLTETQLNQMALFQEQVLTVNAYMNLTAITDDEAFTVKHFIDSLTLLKWVKPGLRVIDVGTGAGFPGVPLKIARPDIRLTLMDSLRKRILFLTQATEKLGLDGITCLHARAEDLARTAEHHGQYDISTVRAVARLDKLSGYTLPFLKKGGLLLSMKGPEVLAEVKEALPMIKKAGGRLAEVCRMDIAPDITHSVIVIEKLK